MAESALIVRVPEAEPHVHALRERWDPAAREGVPAHVTVLYPFLSPDRIDARVLERVQAALASAGPFAFRLARLERFPGAVVYLAPDPAEPFVALTHALVREFPDHPPYGGQFASIVPHLTVAHATGAEAADVERALRRSLPSGDGVAAACREITLIENSAGRWRPLRSFALDGAR